MANPEHLAKLAEGVDAWNKWRERHPKTKPDLAGADLSEQKLSFANLAGAGLERANLFETDLSGADLRKASLLRAYVVLADLQKADLRGADLTHTIFDGANLSSANLGGAHLLGTLIFSCGLRDANLGEAVLDGCMLCDLDLASAVNLDTVIHRSPSTIGVDTVYASRGKISEPFLRGCGVPDDFITYAKSLAANPIEFYSCFISYSTKDQDFADRLYADLQNKGVRCWFAPHDIQGGRKLHEQIDEAIRLHDKLLLILSPHSMESEWVKTEIAKARKREVRDKRRVLFPIRLAPFETLRDWECFDADTGKDSAREIREYFIPDFSNWKNHDSYQEAFQRLLSDLKASETKP